VVNAPEVFERTLDPVPGGVFIKDGPSGKADLVVLFACRMADVYEQFPLIGRGAL
jgi:hypothetical protein